MAADAFHRTCRRAIDLIVAGELYDEMAAGGSSLIAALARAGR